MVSDRSRGEGGFWGCFTSFSDNADQSAISTRVQDGHDARRIHPTETPKDIVMLMAAEKALDPEFCRNGAPSRFAPSDPIEAVEEDANVGIRLGPRPSGRVQAYISPSRPPADRKTVGGGKRGTI